MPDAADSGITAATASDASLTTCRLPSLRLRDSALVVGESRGNVDSLDHSHHRVEACLVPRPSRQRGIVNFADT